MTQSFNIIDTGSNPELPLLEYVHLQERYAVLEGKGRVTITNIFDEDGEELLFNEVDAELYPVVHLTCGPDDEGYWYNLTVQLAKAVADDSPMH